MKKLVLTIAVVLGLSMTTFADPDGGGGLFQRGEATPENNAFGDRDALYENVLLPNHNLTGNHDANPELPLGSGVAVLLGLGAAYLVGKKRREE